MLRTRLRSRWRPGGAGGFFPGANLDMNFAQSRYLGATPASLTVTRASDGYAESSEGVWSVFSSNVARITNRGLLVEEARTNGVRNNSMQGATAGVIGSGGALPTNWAHGGGSTSGLTVTVSLGTENGIDYIDLRYSGTVSGSGHNLFMESSAVILTSPSQVWNASAFIKLVSGTTTGMTALRFEAAGIGGSFTSQTGDWFTSRLPTSSLVRYTGTGTADASVTSARPSLTFGLTNGAAADFTIRIGWPQLELGAFATSPIRTTSGAVTRAADAVSLTSVAWLTSQAPMTLFAETNIPQTNTAIAYRAVEIDNGTNTARISNSAGNWLGVYNTDGSATAGAVAANVVQKSVVGIAANDLAACMNGGTVGTDASVTALTGLNRVTFGASTLTGSVLLNGYIRRVAYFPSRLANAELQAITT
jgi:hypothetical protein